jgi:hypothetical protein
MARKKERPSASVTSLESLRVERNTARMWARALHPSAGTSDSTVARILSATTGAQFHGTRKSVRHFSWGEP